MPKRLYYNPVSATGDPRQGMGYGKSQKIPSHGTGAGSTWAMGWNTGIYPPEDDEHEIDDDWLDIPFEDDDEWESFFSKINYGYSSSDSVKPRADFSSYASTSNRFSTVGLSEQTKIHAVQGIVPIPGSVKYPNGLGLATGGHSTEFGQTRTGPGKRGGDGTQFGISRKPLDTEDDGLRFMSLLDILDITPSERNFLKQQIKIKKLLSKTENLYRKEINI
jgi:hypothetical protein